MEKWTLAEGIEKLLPTNPEQEPEISDLGISKRELCLDVSIAEGYTTEGEDGISVILSTLGEEEGQYMHLSGAIAPMEGESLQELAVRAAAMLGIKPEERVWEDGEGLGSQEVKPKRIDPAEELLRTIQSKAEEAKEAKTLS